MDGYTLYRIAGHIKILGKDYDFKEESNLGRDRFASGVSCGNGLYIKVEDSLPISVKQSVMIHEIIEQLNDAFELELPHRTIQSLESGLFSVIKENPGIFNFEEDGQ